ncbi:HNH endonuclease [Faecalimonas sp.]
MVLILEAFIQDVDLYEYLDNHEPMEDTVERRAIHEKQSIEIVIMVVYLWYNKFILFWRCYMGKWMIAANGKMYDHASAFQKWGFIDWRQRANYKTGDLVYIYCTKPYKKVMYKTMVIKEAMGANEIVNDSKFWLDIDEYRKALSGKYARLKLIEQVDSDKLALDYLKKHGLKAAPQGPIKVKDELGEYIDKYMDDSYSNGIFPDSDLPNASYEGAVSKVLVNKYERSSIARQKCIEYHGCKCSICGINFEKVYGEIGKGFIHVHHIVPLNEINEEYIVDYKKDLIPVCPNCHAMLHRKIDGKELSVKAVKNSLRIHNN